MKQKDEKTFNVLFQFKIFFQNLTQYKIFFEV